MRLWRVEMLWLALVAGLLVLAVWWLPGGSLNSDSYSVSFAGKKAFYEILRRLDPDVSRSVEKLIPRPEFSDRLLVLGPARAPSAQEWDSLYFAVLDGASLVFAASAGDPHLETGAFGARVVSQSPLDKLQSKNAEADPADEEGDEDAVKDAVEKPDDAPAPPAGAPKAEADPPPESQPAPAADSKEPDSKASPAQDAKDDKQPPKLDLGKLLLRERPAETELVEGRVDWKSQAWLELDGLGWEVLVSVDSRPQVARMRLGAGTIVLVATDEIFSNKSLTEPDRALLAYRIIEQAPPVGRTWVDESLNSSGVPKVLGILFDPAFRPVTLQLILIVVLFGWSGSRRFGPAEPPTAPRRRSIVEHAEALGILYYRAGAGAHAVRAQLDFLKQELRRLFATAFRAENVDALARRAGLEERDVRTLLRDAEVDPNSRIPNAEASRLLQRLADLSARIRVNSSRPPARRVPPAGKTVPPVPEQRS